MAPQLDISWSSRVSFEDEKEKQQKQRVVKYGENCQYQREAPICSKQHLRNERLEKCPLQKKGQK